MSLELYLIIDSETRIRMCKEFFVGALGICNSQIKTCLKHSDSTGTPNPKPTHQLATTTPKDKIKSVVAHINSFPRDESHYCRAATHQQYLEPTLSIRNGQYSMVPHRLSFGSMSRYLRQSSISAFRHPERMYATNAENLQPSHQHNL